MPTSSSSGLTWITEHWQQLITHPLIAALAGSVMASFHAFPGASRSAKLLNGISSFIVGIYLGPAINEWQGITSERISALIIVAASLGGLILANGFLEYLKTTQALNWPLIGPFLRVLTATNGAPPIDDGGEKRS